MDNSKKSLSKKVNILFFLIICLAILNAFILVNIVFNNYDNSIENQEKINYAKFIISKNEMFFNSIDNKVNSIIYKDDKIQIKLLSYDKSPIYNSRRLSKSASILAVCDTKDTDLSINQTPSHFIQFINDNKNSISKYEYDKFNQQDIMRKNNYPNKTLIDLIVFTGISILIYFLLVYLFNLKNNINENEIFDKSGSFFLVLMMSVLILLLVSIQTLFYSYSLQDNNKIALLSIIFYGCIISKGLVTASTKIERYK